MLKSRFLRRSLLTLVVSAAPGIASTSALNADTGARPASAALRRAHQSATLRQTPTDPRQASQAAIRQIQHQPAGQAPQGNNAVLQELNKLFQEDGQQMPPMESHKLPYANSPRMENVRPKQQSTKKPSLLNRIFGRFRGNSAEPEAAAGAVDVATPPPIVMPGNGQARSFQQPAPGNTQPRSTQSVSGVRRDNATRFNTAQAQPQPAAGNQVTRPRTAAPSGVYRPAGQSNQIAAPSGRQVVAPSPQPVQVQPRPQVQPQANVRPQAQPQPADDGFIDPFQSSDPTAETEVMLDLDSLIENTPESDTFENSVESSNSAAEVTTPPQAQLAEQNPFASEVAETTEPEVEAPAANPFTGVQLDMSDEQYFGTPEPAATPITPESFESEAVTQESANPFELAEPSAPKEGFGGNLPSIDLPLAESSEVETSATQLVPAETNTLRQAEELQPVESSASSVSSDSAQASEETQSTVQKQEGASGRTSAVNAELIRQQQQRIRREVQKEMIASRSDQAGFKGFCPVVLRDQRELLDSSADHSATFGLTTYHFSSAQAKATFEADPSRYAPAAGGSDVVLLVNTGEEQEGSVEFALWYRDRLYLFRSRQTMALFSQNPQQFANQY